MSTSQYSTAPQNRVNSPSRSQSEGQFVNITLDVLESGILPVLTGRLREVLLIFAGLSLMDTRSQRYRTCYISHGWLGNKLDVKRSTATGYVNALEELGVIGKVGKHKPTLSGKGQQPSLRYAIADFDELIKLASKLVKRDKKSFDKKALDRVDKSREGVGPVQHPVDEKVLNGSNTYMLNGSNTHPPKVLNGSNTKRYVDPLEKEVGKAVAFPPAENRDNFEGETADLDDDEIERQKLLVRERLSSILEAAQLTQKKQSFIIRAINQEAEKGETRAEKHRIVVEAIDQLEFEFASRMEVQATP